VLAYGKIDATVQAAASKFGFVVLNMYPSMGVTNMQALINNLRTRNPSIQIAQYTALNEMAGSAVTTDDTYAAVTQVNSMNWWVRTSTGAQVQWTGLFNNFEINLTAWAPADATGKRWPQWKATNDVNTMYGKLTGIDYVFSDNVMYQPRYDADHMRIGTNQLRTDPTIQSAFRKGYVDFWNTLRALKPTLKVMGNADNDLSQAEFKGQLEGAFNECLIGKTWSIETWGGWQAMMARYRAQLANTKSPKAVIFQHCSINGVQPANMRYGFASALLENGYYAYTVNGLTVPHWADEFSAPIGTALDAPPTAPTASGIWMRRYTNGLVLVNPSASTLSINVGTGYKRLLGTQDPVVNNGAVESMVTVPPKGGLLMIKS
jgi:hypothetical protein